MEKIFDQVINNLSTKNRHQFEILAKQNLINKKTCNRFAKYIKNSNIKSKVIEICYCKQLNKTIKITREFEKLKKFFKKTNYSIIKNFLEIKIKIMKDEELLLKLYDKLIPVFKNYLHKNNFKYDNNDKNFKFLFIIFKERVLPILRSFVDINFGNTSHGFINKICSCANYKEQIIVNTEISKRFALLLKYFSMRVIYLVTDNLDGYDHFYNLPLKMKIPLYSNIVMKLIKIINNYIDLYSKYEFKNNELDNIIYIEINTLSSETDSLDEVLLNNYSIINDINMIDSYEDKILEEKMDLN